MNIRIFAVAAFALGTAAFAFSSEKAAKQPTSSPYVGAEQCRTCHPDRYDDWKKTKHAKTCENLGDEVMPDCARCHTTGYQFPGGYDPAKKNKDRLNVQCEGCHGGGTAHIAAPPELKKRSISVNGLDCRLCHKPHSDHSSI